MRKVPNAPSSSRTPTSSSGKRSRTGGQPHLRSGEDRLAQPAEGLPRGRADLEVAVPGEVEAAGQLAEGRQQRRLALEAAEVVPVALRRVVVDRAVAVQP